MPDQPKMKQRCIAALLLITSGLIIISSCHTPTKEEKGKALADKYCSGCHLPVSPALLDKETWTKHVLPAMAPKLGIKVWSGDQYYPPMPGDKPGLISINEWTALVEYYREVAPEKLTPAKAGVPLQHDWSIFSLRTPEVTDTNAIAATTMVSFHPTNGGVFTSDGQHAHLIQWDKNLHAVNTWTLPSPAVNVLYPADRQTTGYTHRNRKYACSGCSCGYYHPPGPGCSRK
jgi:hypothetical protein